MGDEHISFSTSKIGSLVDVNQSKYILKHTLQQLLKSNFSTLLGMLMDYEHFTIWSRIWSVLSFLWLVSTLRSSLFKLGLWNMFCTVFFIDLFRKVYVLHAQPINKWNFLKKKTLVFYINSRYEKCEIVNDHGRRKVDDETPVVVLVAVFVEHLKFKLNVSRFRVNHLFNIKTCIETRIWIDRLNRQVW